MASGFRKIWAYNPLSPPSGAIPRFPVWEVTAVASAIYSGMIGLTNPQVGKLIGLIGPSALVFYCLLVLGGVTALVGLFFKAPTGLLVCLLAHGLLATVAGSMYIAISVDLGTIAYPGTTTLMFLAFGTALRTGQLLGQLWRAQHIVETHYRDGKK